MRIQDVEEQYRSFMGTESCCNDGDVELEKIEQNIADCKTMLAYAIDLTDKEEINFWRRMLQKAKVQRREILAT